MKPGSDFVRGIREAVRSRKELEAMGAAKAARDQGDLVGAAHHEARARALHDSWRNPEAAREVDEEAISQLRDSLSHPDLNVRQSARQGLDALGVLIR